MQEFSVSDKDIRGVEEKKKKNLTAPGVDGIERFGWEILAAS